MAALWLNRWKSFVWPPDDIYQNRQSWMLKKVSFSVSFWSLCTFKGFKSQKKLLAAWMMYDFSFQPLKLTLERYWLALISEDIAFWERLHHSETVCQNSLLWTSGTLCLSTVSRKPFLWCEVRNRGGILHFNAMFEEKNSHHLWKCAICLTFKLCPLHQAYFFDISKITRIFGQK